MHTIGQVAEMFGLPVSTVRYYDNQGLFPNLERKGGVRRFGEGDVERLRVIECLKKSGMEIKDIKQFMDWCQEGPATFGKRHELFERQKQNVEAEIERLNHTLDMINYKLWYYDQAQALGHDPDVAAMYANGEIPEAVRAAYERSHGA